MARGDVGVLDGRVVELLCCVVLLKCSKLEDRIYCVYLNLLTSPQVPRPSVSLSKGQLEIRQESSFAARRKLALCLSDILPGGHISLEWSMH